MFHSPPSCAILIPTYNTGSRVCEVVRGVVAGGFPVIVVADGSNDGTTEQLEVMVASGVAMTLLKHRRNFGKGQAILTGAEEAARRGFTHILTFDADGQHPVASIPEYLAASAAQPGAWVAGYPVFDQQAPWERVFFRRLAVFWTRLISLDHALRDAMFGMRVYPVGPLLATLGPSFLGRRYDVECVAAIKLAWAGCPVVNVATPVRYFSAGEGGVSHYHYLRDNFRLGWVLLCLLPRAAVLQISRCFRGGAGRSVTA